MTEQQRASNERGRDAATLVMAAIEHLREKLPAMMARGPLPRPAELGGPMENRVPKAALVYLADGILGDFEMAPDSTWWRDYFLISGHHMIATDYGWEPGDAKSEYEPDDIYDEVNAPDARSDAPSGVHKPFTDDGVTYCGWDGHEGCGEVWPCRAVRQGAET